MDDIKQLFKRYDDCKLCKSSGNKLQHILAGGKFNNPKVALVFINPTHTNISSAPDWKGHRFPFIGITRFWQILAVSGWIAKGTVTEFDNFGWNKGTIKLLEDDLHKKGIYITNLVKCTFPHGNYPEKKYFDYHLPLLEKELSIVRPTAIISFGGLSTKYLNGENLTFKKYFVNPHHLEYKNIPVYPCYFPVGRGNPKLAIEVLRKLAYLLE
ncbi:MAG: uracil-DNA glycosylase family protein [Patescibacteria group bacterium]